MRAIEILVEEHRLLLRTLRGLEHLLTETARNDHLDAGSAAQILEFLERFADGSHQDKEEEFLFPELLAQAPPRVRRDIAQLLRVHEGERVLLDRMRGSFEAAAYGDPWSTDLFVTHAAAYIAFQRRHAATEEKHLFRLAQKLLDDEADRKLIAGFAAIDRRYRRRGGKSPERVVAELCERLGIEDAVQHETAA